ncbi:MAG: NYN domain-containing protein [bacterium]|nr:NYN domain-containing protein [bacterium]
MNLRVMIFVDARYFNNGFAECGEGAGRAVNYYALGRWIVKMVCQREKRKTCFAGLHYYTGEGGDSRTNGHAFEDRGRFLDALERLPGVTVHSFPTREMHRQCNGCGRDEPFTVVKGMDTSLALDLYRHHVGRVYDVAVLVSGDADFKPAVDNIQFGGGHVYLASWGSYGVARPLSGIVWDRLDLRDGLDVFSHELNPKDAQQRADLDDQMLAQITKALDACPSGQYMGVGRLIFDGEDRVSVSSLDLPDVRRAAIERLASAGRIEFYDGPGGSRAVRLSSVAASSQAEPLRAWSADAGA